MPVDDDLLRYLDGKFSNVDTKFGKVHERINKAGEDRSRQYTDIQREIAEIKAAPCRDVERHIEQSHNIYKIVGLVAALLGIGAAVAAAVSALMQKGGTP